MVRPATLILAATLAACAGRDDRAELYDHEKAIADLRVRLDAVEGELKITQKRVEEQARQQPAPRPLLTAQPDVDPYILQNGAQQTRYSDRSRCEMALESLRLADAATSERTGVTNLAPPTRACIPG